MILSLSLFNTLFSRTFKKNLLFMFQKEYDE